MIAYRAGIPMLFTVDEWLDVLLIAIDYDDIDPANGCISWAAQQIRSELRCRQ